jgi:hypothetical protein
MFMKKIRYIFPLIIIFNFNLLLSQEKEVVYKKRVLENTEIDLLGSFYSQDGDNGSVTGGVGSEELIDISSAVTISVPLNDDDVLTIDAGVSAYTSASTSNQDPFDGEIDEEGSPWIVSTGASRKFAWASIGAAYSHSSDDRNKVWNANMSFSLEYDYVSFGFGGGFTRLFNEKNTKLEVNASIFLDKWRPFYPIEIGAELDPKRLGDKLFMDEVIILNKYGEVTDKNSDDSWRPFKTELVDKTNRNNYSLSVVFSQILSAHLQFSVFADVISQQGWLANPTQRVYFEDIDNYYVGEATSIANYTSRSNTNVFHLADDIERLPGTRLKTPFGARLNYYVNQKVVIRTFYRNYTDDWGVDSSTYEVELPLKLMNNWTFTPSYRYFNQTAADYFAAYNEHSSTQDYYTSDYDLSNFDANQFGLSIRYTDNFLKTQILNFGLKTAEIKYNYYERSTGLKSGIVSIGFKFIQE